MSGYSDLSSKLENSRHDLFMLHRNCLRRIARHDEQQFSKDSLVNVMEKFVKTVNVMDETILVPCRLMDRQVGDSTDIIPVPPKTSSHYSQHHNHHHHQHSSVASGGCRNNRSAATVHDFLSSADLFNLYNLLNSLKKDLLWTRNSDENNDEGNGNDDDLITSTVSSLIDSEVTRYNSTTEISEQPKSKPQHKRNASNGSTRSDSSIIVAPATSSTKGHIRRPSTASMISSNSVSNLSDSESEISNENDSGIESEGNCRTGGASSTTSNSSNNSTNNVDKATDLVRQCRTHLSGLHRCLEQMTEAANYLTARYQSDIGPV